MKVFISQPMAGKADEDILKERLRVASLYPTSEIVNSFFNDAPKNTSPLQYLGEAIKRMSEADVVHFCKGWEEARGCRIEHDCAIAYGKVVKYD